MNTLSPKHRRVAIATVAILLAFIPCLAQKNPKFSDYPVRQKFTGKPARVDLASAKGAKYYRTRLREAAREGANFAGHYAIGVWGCGSPCLMAGMVDLKSGKVTWVPSPEMMVFDVAFNVNSKLLIINSHDVLNKKSPNGPPNWIGGVWPSEIYLRWNGRSFVEIKKK